MGSSPIWCIPLKVNLNIKKKNKNILIFTLYIKNMAIKEILYYYYILIKCCNIYKELKKVKIFEYYKYRNIIL